MFRIVCDPSSGTTELCLTEITRGSSHIFFVCLVGVWQRNFEPAVCVPGTRHTHRRFKITLLKHRLRTRKISRLISIKHVQHSLMMDCKRSETCWS